MSRTRSRIITVITCLVASTAAQAGWSDGDDDSEGHEGRPGVQPATWPEPSTLTVYTDGLAGTDKAKFMEGIRAWTDRMDKITLVFKNGDPPDDLTEEQKKFIVKVEQTDDRPGPNGEVSLTTYGTYFPPVNPPTDPPTYEEHGIIVGPVTIKIWKELVGHGHNNMMKNLGTHEFGHALGLDDSAEFQDPVPEGYNRNGAMDPSFNTDSPYKKPTAAEWNLLDQYYDVPEPGPVCLLLLAAATCGRRRAA
ncbi:MAG: hypothetical protein KAS72_15615 [Phycisphaerales bacterium]|nr:hypothetical protein [Phycisphaerales bacterium]